MKFLHLTIVILTAVLAVSYEKDMPDSTAGNPSAARKVLVAGKSSAFKDAVVGELLQTLGEKNYFLTVTGFGNLASQKIGDYGAILLVSSLQGGKIDGRAVEFIARSNSDHKIIVFYTRGSDNPPPGWAKPLFTVDAVSSASVTGRERDLADKLATLVRKRF